MLHGADAAADNGIGGANGAGIGSGMEGAGERLYFYSGTVNAHGGYDAAGIGGGRYVPAHDITITGGYITASGHYGAGIGGGRWSKGRDITMTDANLTLLTYYRTTGSMAADVGYGDLVYNPEKLVENPSDATNNRIRVGSKEGKIAWIGANGYALRADGTPTYCIGISDFLIPDSDGMVDLSLLPRP